MPYDDKQKILCLNIY